MKQPPTQHDVAKAAGVSVMTVSRVLRGLPHVSEATRERVEKAVEAVGYTPDPDLSAMMQRVRSRRERAVHATLAVLRGAVPKDDLARSAYHFVPIEPIRERALKYGYRVEEFWLERDGLTPQKCDDILEARGIEGVIVSPQSTSLPCAEIDYSRYASAAFGHALTRPALHLSATNMTLGLLRAAEELRARGYRRIGVAVTHWINDRVQYGYSSGLNRLHEVTPEDEHVPLLLLPNPRVEAGYEPFADWMRLHQPEVVISFHSSAPGWLKRLGLRIPEDVGYLVHDLMETDGSLAGLDHRREEIAKAAVDLVVTQLWRGEKGIPAVPRQILVPPRWIEGRSLKEPSLLS